MASASSTTTKEKDHPKIMYRLHEEEGCSTEGPNMSVRCEAWYEATKEEAVKHMDWLKLIQHSRQARSVTIDVMRMVALKYDLANFWSPTVSSGSDTNFQFVLTAHRDFKVDPSKWNVKKRTGGYNDLTLMFIACDPTSTILHHFLYSVATHMLRALNSNKTCTVSLPDFLKPGGVIQPIELLEDTQPSAVNNNDSERAQADGTTDMVDGSERAQAENTTVDGSLRAQTEDAKETLAPPSYQVNNGDSGSDGDGDGGSRSNDQTSTYDNDDRDGDDGDNGAGTTTTEGNSTGILNPTTTTKEGNSTGTLNPTRTTKKLVSLVDNIQRQWSREQYIKQYQREQDRYLLKVLGYIYFTVKKEQQQQQSIRQVPIDTILEHLARWLGISFTLVKTNMNYSSRQIRNSHRQFKTQYNNHDLSFPPPPVGHDDPETANMFPGIRHITTGNGVVLYLPWLLSSMVETPQQSNGTTSVLPPPSSTARAAPPSSTTTTPPSSTTTPLATPAQQLPVVSPAATGQSGATEESTNSPSKRSHLDPAASSSTSESNKEPSSTSESNKKQKIGQNQEDGNLSWWVQYYQNLFNK